MAIDRFVMGIGSDNKSSFLSRLVLQAVATFAAVLASAASGFGQDISPDTAAPIACGPEQCLVPLEALTHQDDMPFVFSNKIMDEEHPRWDQFRRPILRHPDARSCLLDEAVQGDVVDLLAVDWSQFGSSPSFVRFHRIFSTLDQAALILGWIEAVGMQHGGIVEWGGITLARDELPPRSFAIYAAWSREQYYEHRPTILNSLFDWGALTSWGPYVYLYSDGTFHSVSVNGRSTWN
ncbi:hypothetical protein [Gymnodinialimonas ulvae]|uniref:hypothetical protein n=1 Tax=Gymnodinialimonas ulvae TaxID=3126504 RepID=UPI00309E3DEA